MVKCGEVRDERENEAPIGQQEPRGTNNLTGTVLDYESLST